MTVTRPDPDRLAELEEERRYLLQSLRDLDREHEFGDVDDVDYVELRDDYTVRAANVLREIDSGREELAARSPRRWGRILSLAGGVIAVGVAIGLFVASSSGQRLPGQELSGASPGSDRSSLLAQARAAMAADPQTAVELYSQVLEDDPDHPEALTYSGWLSVIVASGSDDEELREVGRKAGTARIEAAIAADPDYADAHCLRAVVAARFEPEPDTALAREEGERCLALNPPQQIRGLVEQFVDSLPE